MSNIEMSIPSTDAAVSARQTSKYVGTISTTSAKAIAHINSTVQSSSATAVSAANQTANQKAQSSEKNIDAAVSEINQVFQSASTSLAFYVDKSSQRFVVEVKDTNTGESIVKFPGEAVLKIAESIESLKGVLFDKTM
ncbi:MAG: flagellar protein FlaG [Porticoccaceae bacterium]|nr:flagellar protein FlaG [Porticoccaceae bacterium]